MSAVRRAASVLPAAFLLLAAAAPAHATGYRYWSFWERTAGGSGGWVYATQGPSTARPDDGAVEGFRFAVSEDSADASRPRGAADFGTICAGTPARSGTKRVAVVLDFGTPADAPSGETPPARRTACARIPAGATAADALAAVAPPLRYDTNALLCAIAGFPKKGCGEQVSGSAGEKATAGEKKSGSDGGPSLGLPVGAGVVAVLAGAAVWQYRRRRDDSA
ncbi:SCO2322 family protein [Streptomyces sp. NBC_00557]|uniref:SCO2322 family protein n=1 Tax=Streptomyces sp. NBC_00557 TaxID=2975776 RepID=UPI002E81833C|nr:SCO2322 family protein [Streptomyces sp. NBC_00557]WUC37398.1 SCO2322 family protein [Streptomyces sp. NBC_00557]